MSKLNNEAIAKRFKEIESREFKLHSDKYSIELEEERLHREHCDLIEQYCDNWYKENKDKYFMVRKYKEIFEFYFINSISQYPNKGGYHLYGYKFHVIDGAVLYVSDGVNLDYYAGEFYQLINGTHTDKMYETSKEELHRMMQVLEGRILKEERSL